MILATTPAAARPITPPGPTANAIPAPIPTPAAREITFFQVIAGLFSSTSGTIKSLSSSLTKSSSLSLSSLLSLP